MDKTARETARDMCDKATLGPWESTACDDGLMMVATTGDTICFGDPNHQEPDDTANGAFIAAARTLLPQALDALDAADSDNAKTLRILRIAYTTMAFAFNRLHNSARSRDGELCLDLQKVRAKIEAHFKDIGVTL